MTDQDIIEWLLSLPYQTLVTLSDALAYGPQFVASAAHAVTAVRDVQTRQALGDA